LKEYATTLLPGRRDGHLVDQAQLAADLNPEVVELVAHLGLLVVGRGDGIETAYAMLKDSEGLRHSIDDALLDQADPLRAMALARLHAGVRPDDGDAHFAHAVAAVAARSPQEAERAIPSMC
jgi:hypothetical protein